MVVKMELTPYEFKYNESWSGGRATCEDLDEEEIEAIFDILWDEDCDEPMTLTELNDFFWFERDTIAEWLGFNDYDEILDRNKSK